MLHILINMKYTQKINLELFSNFSNIISEFLEQKVNFLSFKRHKIRWVCCVVRVQLFLNDNFTTEVAVSKLSNVPLREKMPV